MLVVTLVQTLIARCKQPYYRMRLLLLLPLTPAPRRPSNVPHARMYASERPQVGIFSISVCGKCVHMCVCIYVNVCKHT